MRWKLLYFIGVVVLAAATYLVLRRGFDQQVFLDSLTKMRPAWIAAAAAAVFLSYGIRAVRWRRILIPLKSVPLGSLVMGTILGFAAINALGRAGEVVRPLWVARREKIPLTASFASIVVERVFDTLMVLAIFAIGLEATELPGVAPETVARMSQAAWVLLAGSVTALALLAFSHRNMDAVNARIPFRKLREMVKAFTSGSGGLSDPRRLGIIAADSILVWGLVALQFWLMLGGLDLDLPIAMVCLIMAVSALGSLAQIPAIGGGFQAAFVFSATVFARVGTEAALAAALMAWLITYVPVIVVAALYMMWKGLSTKDLIASRRPGRSPSTAGG